MLNEATTIKPKFHIEGIFVNEEHQVHPVPYNDRYRVDKNHPHYKHELARKVIPYALYLFAEYGVEETFNKFADTRVTITGPQSSTAGNTVITSDRIRLQGVDSASGLRKVVLVVDAAVRNTAVENLAAAFFYVLGRYQPVFDSVEDLRHRKIWQTVLAHAVGGSPLEVFTPEAEDIMASILSDGPWREYPSGIKAFRDGLLSSAEYVNRKARLAQEVDLSLQGIGEMAKDIPTVRLDAYPRYHMPEFKEFQFNKDMEFSALRLPYPICLFVIGTGKEKIVVVAEQSGVNELKLKRVVNYPRPGLWDLDAQIDIKLENGKASYRWVYSRSLGPHNGMIACILGFLNAQLQERITVEVMEAPPTDRDIPPAREGVIFRTVKMLIGMGSKKSEWQGGTHASPREHKRAGHWRAGKWIPATTVNKGVLGRVEKEYKIVKKPEGDV